MSLGNNTLALRCFQEQLDRAQVSTYCPHVPREQHPLYQQLERSSVPS
jgi:hypothetical protein